jgi:hypothetical protein
VAVIDEATRIKLFIRMGRDPGIHARVECFDVFCWNMFVEVSILIVLYEAAEFGFVRD